MQQFLNTIVFSEGISLNETKWVQLLRPGVWDHPKHGTLIIDDKVINGMIANFNNHVRGIDLAIDEDHQAEKGAAGWFKGLENRGQDGLWALIEWTSRGVELIRDKIYKYLSAEFDWDWINEETGKNYKYVLFGAALTNRPFIKGMAAVNLSEFSDKEINMSSRLKRRKVKNSSVKLSYPENKIRTVDDLIDEEEGEIVRNPGESEEDYRKRIYDYAESRRPKEGMIPAEGEDMIDDEMGESDEELDTSEQTEEVIEEDELEGGPADEDDEYPADDSLPGVMNTADPLIAEQGQLNVKDPGTDPSYEEEESVDPAYETLEGTEAIGDEGTEETDTVLDAAQAEEDLLRQIEEEDEGESEDERFDRYLKRAREQKLKKIVRDVVDGEETPEERRERLQKKMASAKLHEATQLRAGIVNFIPKRTGHKETRLSVKLTEMRERDPETAVLLAETLKDLEVARRRQEIHEINALLKVHFDDGKLTPVTRNILREVLLSEVPTRGLATYKLSEIVLSEDNKRRVVTRMRPLRQVIDVLLSEMPRVVMFGETARSETLSPVDKEHKEEVMLTEKGKQIAIKRAGKLTKTFKLSEKSSEKKSEKADNERED